MAAILVIEDNVDNRELMTYLLSAFGHSIETAGDGERALDLLAEAHYDLVVCDIHLPKLDGYEIVKTMKADARLAPVPVVAVTALAMVGDRERLLEAGFDDYVSKPIDPQEFVSRIDAWVAGPRAPGQGEG